MFANNNWLCVRLVNFLCSVGVFGVFMVRCLMFDCVWCLVFGVGMFIEELDNKNRMPPGRTSCHMNSTMS